MLQPITAAGTLIQRRSTPHASLAAFGVQLRYLDLFGPIREQVHIAKKVVRHTPR